MAVVAYLLGAGASAECLPVVNGMADDMDMLIKQIDAFYPASNHNLPNKRDKEFNRIYDVLKTLKSKCLDHFSIDTYAKKLYLTDISSFEKLKLDLSLYFTLKQTVTLADKRYDNFLSSVMTTRHTLPSKTDGKFIFLFIC